MKADYPNADATKAAALAYFRKCSSFQDNFDLMQGRNKVSWFVKEEFSFMEAIVSIDMYIYIHKLTRIFEKKPCKYIFCISFEATLSYVLSVPPHA